jgi:hypothetical protein
MEEDKNMEAGEQISPHTNTAPEKVHLAGSSQIPSNVKPWAFLSGAILGGARKPKGRVDMLADEDQSEYNDYRAVSGRRPGPPLRGASGHSFGSSISNWYGGAGGSRRNWTGWVGQSLGSLKSVNGAMIARRDATTSSAAAAEAEIPWWDQDAVPLDPFGDDMAMREQPEIGSTPLALNNVSGIAAVGVGEAARPRGGMHTSASSYPYSNPTEIGEYMGHGGSVRLVDPSGSAGSHSAEPSASAPLLTAMGSGNTPQSLSSNDHSSSDPSGSSLATTPTGLHTTSIIGSAGATSAPIRRSDSWWARLSKTSRLDRHLSPPTSPRQSTVDNLLEFRDPHPAPKLVPIKERSGSGESSRPSRSDPSRPRSIASSVKTTKTADSEGLEGMAVMDVVQRQGTSTSHGTASSMEDGADDERSGTSGDRDSRESNVLGSDIIQSPLEAPPPLTAPSLKTTNSGSSGELSSVGSVADRIQGWERRNSQDSPVPARRERRSTYGLAPRASMFIANPDERAALDP